jgi:hypothetical protein
MSPRLLQAQHFVRQFAGCHGVALQGWKFLADLVILAKHTPQVTPGEENGSRSPGSRYGRLFPKMQTNMSDLHLRPDHAILSRFHGAVDPAGARTKFAMTERFFQ